MARAIAACVASAFLGFTSPLALAQDTQDWVDIKDPQELRALFSDKTHRSRAFVGHYRADGKGQLQMQGSEVRLPRVWALKGSDQVCAGPEGETPTCFHYQRNRKNPNEIVARGEQRGQAVMLWFNVEDGIPKF